MDLYRSGFENSSSVNTVESILYKGLVSTQMRYFLPKLFWVRKVLLEFILMFSKLLSVTDSAWFGLCLKLLLLLFSDISLLFCLLNFLVQLSCYFLVTLNLMWILFSRLLLSHSQLLSPHVLVSMTYLLRFKLHLFYLFSFLLL